MWKLTNYRRFCRRRSQTDNLTFSLLADRAKAIKTKAVINESPTEKLIRELREENQRLLEQLKQGGGAMVIQGEPGQPQTVGVSEEGFITCFSVNLKPFMYTRLQQRCYLKKASHERRDPPSLLVHKYRISTISCKW